jgi:hypothetical protein
MVRQFEVDNGKVDCIFGATLAGGIDISEVEDLVFWVAIAVQVVAEGDFVVREGASL